MRRYWTWPIPLPSPKEAIEGAKGGDVEMAHEAAFQFVEETGDSASDPTRAIAAAIHRILLDRQRSTLDVSPDTLRNFLNEEHSTLASYVAERLAEEGHKSAAHALGLVRRGRPRLPISEQIERDFEVVFAHRKRMRKLPEATLRGELSRWNRALEVAGEMGVAESEIRNAYFRLRGAAALLDPDSTAEVLAHEVEE